MSQAADPVADLHRVERWIRAIDEYERVLPVLTKTRLVKGSMGQVVLNPLAAYLDSIKAELARAETELGLTPLARLRLGITYGVARLTAEALNAALSAEPVTAREAAEAANADDWSEGEWAEG